jgi:uncharacterized protein involved in exopolysaccharide biosynthesis
MVSLITCTVVAVGVGLVLPPRYVASSRLMLDTLKPDPVTGVIIASGSARSYVETQVALIKDYRVTGLVVDELGWANNPELIATYNSEARGAGNDIRRWLAQQIIEGTDVKLADSSNILDISYTGNSPDSARVVADMIRKAYIDVSLATTKDSAGRSASWFDDQANKAQQQLALAEAAKTQYEKENGIVMGAGNTDIETARLADLSGQSVNARSSAAMAAGNAPLMAATGMSGELAEVEQQLAQATQTLGPNHPTYQALLRKRSALSQAAGQAAASAGGAAGAARASIGELDRAYETQKARVISMRDKLDRLNQLQREVDLRRDQYEKAAQRAADFRLQANVVESGLTVLGSAVAPTKPDFPNMPLITFGAIAFGGGLGVLLALLIEMLGRRVRSIDDLEDAIGAPVLAVVSDAKREAKWVTTIKNIFRRKRDPAIDPYTQTA